MNSAILEHCKGIAEVLGSNPVQAWIFFRPYFHFALLVFITAKIILIFMFQDRHKLWMQCLRNELLIKRMRADQNWWRSLLFGSHLFLVLMNYTVKKKVEGKEAPYFEVWSIVLLFFSLYLSWFPSPLKLFCRQLKLIWWIFSRSQLSICNLLALRSIYENNKNFAIKEPWNL